MRPPGSTSSCFYDRPLAYRANAASINSQQSFTRSSQSALPQSSTPNIQNQSLRFRLLLLHVANLGSRSKSIVMYTTGQMREDPRAQGQQRDMRHGTGRDETKAPACNQTVRSSYLSPSLAFSATRVVVTAFQLASRVARLVHRRSPIYTARVQNPRPLPLSYAHSGMRLFPVVAHTHTHCLSFSVARIHISVETLELDASRDKWCSDKDATCVRHRPACATPTRRHPARVCKRDPNAAASLSCALGVPAARPNQRRQWLRSFESRTSSDTLRNAARQVTPPNEDNPGGKTLDEVRGANDTCACASSLIILCCDDPGSQCAIPGGLGLLTEAVACPSLHPSVLFTPTNWHLPLDTALAPFQQAQMLVNELAPDDWVGGWVPPENCWCGSPPHFTSTSLIFMKRADFSPLFCLPSAFPPPSSPFFPALLLPRPVFPSSVSLDRANDI
ncbi:hypothetical protein K438DRAFT_2022986 [Mycena galopus ATCC 62051]|nr:hypothetical protein K438DRAFT_2022986 [Mycena galopus ATCC 62051]